MCRSIRGCKTSEFVFIETVFINIIQHPTTPKFAVKPCDIDVFAKASAIRVVGPTLRKNAPTASLMTLFKIPSAGCAVAMRAPQRIGMKFARLTSSQRIEGAHDMV